MKPLDTPCPYCGHPQMPVPPLNPRPYAPCPSCGKRSRAAIKYTKDGVRLVTYVKTAYGGSDPKRVRTVRLSDAEMLSIEQGRLRLTVYNNRITIAV